MFYLTRFGHVVVVIENVLVFWQINGGRYGPAEPGVKAPGQKQVENYLKTAKCRLKYQVSKTC